MASGIVITVAEKLYALLHSPEFKEIFSMFGYESRLDDLAITMGTIKAVLLDAESKHQSLTHAGRDYVERLKDAVYDADDLLDEFNNMVQMDKIKPGGKISKKIRRFFSRSNPILVAHKMSSEIKKLRENLDKIAKDHQQFGLSDVYVPVKRMEETISYGSEHSIIGREADKEAIVGMLLGDSKGLSTCSFVTIVGIGGLGKTALAQLVYNDSRIIEGRFDKMFWVCVSEDFGMEQIFRKMVGKNGLNNNFEELQNQIRKSIEGKRYLLVLDDVWCESRDEWDKLKAFLDLGGRGSKVLTTTRSKKVASVVGDEPMYELRGLSKENSWNLFKRMAFKQEKEQITIDDDDDVANSSLINLGKEIVKKCANVPLCIRVVGSMLYGQNESKWVSFQSLDLTKMKQGENGIMPILKFSYHLLTPVLKSCFSYCALYPKDLMIKKDELIRLWLALGCLDLDDFRSPEEVGEECFSLLFNKCFLQDITKVFNFDNDEIIFCKMHDLIHDLARDVAGKECQMLDTSNACQIDKKTRHVSLVSGERHNSTRLIGELFEMKTLRTIFQVGYKIDGEIVPDMASIFSSLRRLRVLDLSGSSLKSLSNTISRLSHLRSLNLSRNIDLEVLPESVAKLQNLQVLDLSYTGLRKLPTKIMKLGNLRHLNLKVMKLGNLRHLNLKGRSHTREGMNIRVCHHLTHMPVGMNNMTSLQTLTNFVVGDETSKQKIGQLRDLEALINLSGQLEIIFKSNYRCNLTDLDGAQLLQNTHLKRLLVSWEGLDEADMTGSEHETLLQVLQPKSNLKFLLIDGYQGLKLPAWVESVSTSLPFLDRITLEQCKRLEHLPSMRELSHLKNLCLEHLHNVEFISKRRCDDSKFFPCLEKLKLGGLPKLKGWCGNDCADLISPFPRLRYLNISDCPNLTIIPACPNLKIIHLYKFNEALKWKGSDRGPSKLGTCIYLKDVWTDNVRALIGLLDKSLMNIEKLVIRECMEERLLIEAEGFLIRCPSLRVLQLQYNHELKSLSGSGLAHCTNLQSLQLYGCPNLELDDDKEWDSLHSLSSLELLSLPNKNLPKGLQYSTCLRSLHIQSCHNLEALPDWFSCLKSLTTLTIYDCDKLRNRCRKPDGLDWPQICNISYFKYIDR